MEIDLSRILYPTDFSEISLTALQYALSFSRSHNAQLHCIHVVDEGYQYWMSIGPESVPVGPVIEEFTELARQKLTEFANQHLSDLSPQPVCEVLCGIPFVEINQYARNNRIDLIVLATHGRTGITHALMGSTAEKVVRKAPCPVLTVRRGEHHFLKGPQGSTERLGEGS